MTERKRKPAPTADEIRAWPATVRVPVAGRAFQMGQAASYRKAKNGTFPVDVLDAGDRGQKVVSKYAVMKALGIPELPDGDAGKDTAPSAVAKQSPAASGDLAA